jgi:hypothetical protein
MLERFRGGLFYACVFWRKMVLRGLAGFSDEVAAKDSIFRTCSDPVRLFWYQISATFQIRKFIFIFWHLTTVSL